LKKKKTLSEPKELAPKK
jgi:hypothetical protein